MRDRPALQYKRSTIIYSQIQWGLMTWAFPGLVISDRSCGPHWAGRPGHESQGCQMKYTVTQWPMSLFPLPIHRFTSHRSGQVRSYISPSLAVYIQRKPISRSSSNQNHPPPPTSQLLTSQAILLTPGCQSYAYQTRILLYNPILILTHPHCRLPNRATTKAGILWRDDVFHSQFLWVQCFLHALRVSRSGVIG